MKKWGYKNLTKKNYSSRLEHRQVMEDFWGRRLLPTELIHHKNGNKRDNRIENLEICNNAKEHALKEMILGIYLKPKYSGPFAEKGQSYEQMPKMKIQIHRRATI